jgi:transcriptional regulator with XRE-family HTH domain
MEAHLEPLLRELMGAELRAERHRQRRTLAEVAAAAGVSMQHLSDVERGRKDPSSELLAAILGALGVQLPLLLLRAADGVLADPARDRRDPARRGASPVLERRAVPVGPAGASSPTGSAVPAEPAGTALGAATASRPAPGVTLLAAA